MNSIYIRGTQYSVFYYEHECDTSCFEERFEESCRQRFSGPLNNFCMRSVDTFFV